jgi:hypothetical protein
MRGFHELSLPSDTTSLCTVIRVHAFGGVLVFP